MVASTSPPMTDVAVLIELVPEPVLLVTTGLEVRGANAAARKRWGDEVVGAPLTAVLADDADALRQVVRTLVRTSTPVPAGVRTREDGSASRLVSVAGCRVLDDPPTAAMRFDMERAGQFAALTATVDRMNDEIARRREVEGQLQTLLTTTVAELESSNAVLRRFAKGIAHDLKSPLGTLAGFAEFAATHPGDLEELTPVLERMQEVVRHSIGLVDDLLAEAITATSQDAPEAIDVTDVMGEVRQLLAEDLQVHDLTTADDLPVVEARRGALRQVLLNLVGNAIVHRTAPGRASVHVDAVDHGDRWVLRVHDDGPGIPVEARERVFEDGVRLDVARPGTGYGLGHCRRIVEGLGGRLWLADPERGRGCMACVELPAPT